MARATRLADPCGVSHALIVSLTDRQRIGDRLRGLRCERRQRVIDLARTVQLAPNTIMAIERGHPRIKIGNLQKVAAAYAVTLEALLEPPPPPTLTTLGQHCLTELNDEHLAIAIAYRNARNLVRQAMELLITPEVDASLLALICRLLRDTTCPRLEQLEWVLDDDPSLLTTWARLRTRCLADPSFTQVLEGALTEEERITPLPPLRAARPSSARTPEHTASAPARRA
jgi:transcriptional regulator with XRE-family HTH domain